MLRLLPASSGQGTHDRVVVHHQMSSTRPDADRCVRFELRPTDSIASFVPWLNAHLPARRDTAMLNLIRGQVFAQGTVHEAVQRFPRVIAETRILLSKRRETNT